MKKKINDTLNDLNKVKKELSILHNDMIEQHKDFNRIHDDYRLLHRDLAQQHDYILSLNQTLNVLIRNLKLVEAFTVVGLLLLIVKFMF